MTKSSAARKLNLSEKDFDTLASAAHAVYSHIAGDLGPGPRRDGLWPRRDLIEVVFDAGRVENELLGKGMGFQKPYENAEAIVSAINSVDYRVLLSAMSAAFTYKLYE